MRSRTERQIAHFDASLHSGVANAILPVEEILDTMLEIVRSNRSVREIDNGRRLFGFRDAQIVTSRSGARYLALLALMGDHQAPDPAIINTQTATIDIWEREVHEASALTSHVLLNLAPTTPRGISHSAVMEVAVGLGKSAVTPAIAHLIRTAIDDAGLVLRQDDGTERRFNSKVILDLHADARLIESLERGRLGYITLYGKADPDDFDLPDGAEVTRKELGIKVSLSPDENRREWLHRMITRARLAGYEKMHVDWVDPSPAPGEDARQSTTIQTDIEDVAAVAFAKRAYITLERPLADATRQLSDEMIDKMISHLES